MRLIQAVRQDLLSVGGLGGTLASTVGVAVLGVLSGVILARTLGPTGRGDLAAAIQWASVTLAVADLGLGFAIAHQASTTPERRGELLWFGTLVAVLWGAVVLGATTLILPGLVHPSAAKPLRAALCVVPFGMAMGFQAYLLLGSGRVVAHNAIRLGSALAYTIGVCVIALIGRRLPEEFAWVFVASQALGALVAYMLVLQQVRPKVLSDMPMANSLLRFGVKSHVAAIAAHATLRLDQLLLSVLAPAAELGLYVVGVAVASAVGPLFNASATVLIPRISKIGDPVEAAREAGRTVLRSLIVGLPLIVTACVMLPEIVDVLFGPAFEGAIGAGRVLLAASLFQGMNAILGNAFRSLRRPGVPAIAETIGAVVTSCLLVALLPQLGALGAAFASLLAYSIVTMTYVVALARMANVAFGSRAEPRQGEARGEQR